MKTLLPIFGIITVLNTPFTFDNKVDVEALKKHVKIAMDAGVSGFLVTAMASEVNKLTNSERLQIVELVMREVDNIVPVFVGSWEKNLPRSLALLKEYITLGYENFLFQIPYVNKEQFVKHFIKMANLQPKVIMLQDWDTTGYGLPDELIVDLFNDVETFRCLKIETVLSGLKYSKILELTSGKLHVSGGWAVTQMMEGLQRGIHAFMPTGMHFIYTKIFKDFKNGDINEAERLFRELLPILSFSNQHLDISIQFFKKLLYKQRIYNNDLVRSPIREFDLIQNEIAEKLINRVIYLEEQIKSNTYI